MNREQGETTEKGGNSAEIPAPGSAPGEGEAADKMALDFDDVETPVEAMERFTFNEGYVVIPWDQLADNIMQMEEFIKNYPDSPEYEKVKDDFKKTEQVDDFLKRVKQ